MAFFLTAIIEKRLLPLQATGVLQAEPISAAARGVR